jgi:hypothetical protein
LVRFDVRSSASVRRRRKPMSQHPDEFVEDAVPEPDAYDEDAPLPDEPEDGPEFVDMEVQDA